MKFETTPEKLDNSLPVYKNMKEDPAYQGEGISFHDFEGNDIFGYTMAQEKDGKIIGICGKDGKVPYLHIGDNVRPEGDYMGGLDQDQDAKIVEIVYPFKGSTTDHIVRVKQGDKTVWLKPSEMKINHFSK